MRVFGQQIQAPMKYGIAFLAILFSMGQLKAQQDIEKYLKGSRMKKSGIGLTAAGGLLTVVGISMLSSAKYTTSTSATGSTQYSSTDPNASSGALCLLGGMGMLGAGIPLWAVGAHKTKKYGPQAMSLNLNVAPTGVGLALKF